MPRVFSSFGDCYKRYSPLTRRVRVCMHLLMCVCVCASAHRSVGVANNAAVPIPQLSHKPAHALWLFVRRQISVRLFSIL